MRLAVDVMGGDHAPDAILKGCIDALPVMAADEELVLVGPEGVIRDFLDERKIRDPRISIHHAPDVIEMDDTPAKAVRTKPDSSIVQMTLLGSAKAERRVDAVLSAGNTGACVAAAIMHMKRLQGVHRPGIGVTIPAFHGPLTLCDAGANPEPKATHLWQYGLMAAIYAQRVHGIQNPRIGVMNIGSEEGKGTDIVKEARERLDATPGVNCIGFVEGRDLFDGVADVIVTDGFLGNTLLKMAEGLVKSLFSVIAQEIMTQDPELAFRFEPVVKSIYAKNDYHEFGGAPLLGVNGVCMIAHGSSESRTIRAAIRNSFAYVKHSVNDVIVERLASLKDLAPAVQE